jgi:site-specific DNA-cytosine methylase
MSRVKIEYVPLSKIVPWRECRNLAIAEYKKLSSFPDDFRFPGEPFTELKSWEKAVNRVGNSVPPQLMRAIASCIRDQILAKLP